jgi:hypothetical protein
MLSITDVIDPQSATIRDVRTIGGAAAILTIKPAVEAKDAMSVVMDDLIRFMGKSTGRMYTQQRESFSSSYRIQEPGHLSYGLKVTELSGKIVIQPIAVLEDSTVLQRYVQRIKKLAEEAK